MFKYTICFIKQGSSILLINRQNPPNMGHWNGVGGKIEVQEAPLESVAREIQEETNLTISKEQISYKGVVSWDSDQSGTNGMYVFKAEIDENLNYETPKQTDEGILDWKTIDWVLDENNLGIGQMIPKYLPAVLNENHCYIHHFTIENKSVISYEHKEDTKFARN
ncbi:8-oxo-dGTP diphosphatase [Filobacillus milosensis]|uniref:8-oxo-dGTP diphosphatase n=1 Tax=Filobacillus milosensis TaxID=94137 RepID=A0A4Y8INB8_9BACI|nr:8-oxo-dGTP diphosphatase [Filobacillus milosensis]TFB21729.1 8-oxo-dGTP diphosphatase [Filobacillus milosensis]